MIRVMFEIRELSSGFMSLAVKAESGSGKQAATLSEYVDYKKVEEKLKDIAKEAGVDSSHSVYAEGDSAVTLSEAMKKKEGREADGS